MQTDRYWTSCPVKRPLASARLTDALRRGSLARLVALSGSNPPRCRRPKVGADAARREKRPANSCPVAIDRMKRPQRFRGRPPQVGLRRIVSQTHLLRREIVLIHVRPRRLSRANDAGMDCRRAALCNRRGQRALQICDNAITVPLRRILYSLPHLLHHQDQIVGTARP